jgi:hypothetical protein
MSDAKLTPWFPKSVAPVRIGVYETDFSSGMRFSHFDGKHWNGCWSESEWAQDECDYFAKHGTEGCASGGFRWRGLARNPAA